MKRKFPIIKVSFLLEKKELFTNIVCDRKIEVMRPDELKYLFRKTADFTYEKFTEDECSLSFRENYINSLDSKQKEYLNKVVKEDFSGVLPSFMHICMIIDDYRKTHEQKR